MRTTTRETRDGIDAVSGLLLLESPELAVLVDPRHGAEIVDIVDRRSARCMLGRPGFSAAPPRAGELTEDEWTRSFRGGWQLAAPNAGEACRVGHVHHGFHGAASVAAWTVAGAAVNRVVLDWQGHGLVARREIQVKADAVRAETSWRCALSRPVPMVLTEHLTLGRELIVPAVALSVAGGQVSELRAEPRTNGAPWPSCRLLDGRVVNIDHLDVTRTSPAYACVAQVDHGRASARNVSTGAGVELTWDHTMLPHLWLWRESAKSRGWWRGQTEILGLEPASVPHGAGLAQAIAREEATWVAPGRPFSTTLEVRVFERRARSDTAA